MKLEGKVVIVTGSARGIGKACCLRLAREGAKVVVADIADTTSTVKEIEEDGGTAIGLKVDVSSEQDTLRMAEDTVSRFGRIDVLFNNAAIFYGVKDTPFEELDPKDWDRVMAVNVKGGWLCARAVVPYMKKQGKGKIINMTSGAAFHALPKMMHYLASKGAIITMTRAMANELGEHNICVNALAPGFVLSEAGLQLRTEEQTRERVKTTQCIKRPELPEDLAGAVVFLASDDADMMTGQTMVVDGGQVKH